MDPPPPRERRSGVQGDDVVNVDSLLRGNDRKGTRDDVAECKGTTWRSARGRRGGVQGDDVAECKGITDGWSARERHQRNKNSNDVCERAWIICEATVKNGTFLVSAQHPLEKGDLGRLAFAKRIIHRLLIS